jgi:nucleotide-binding universal stress UspA family protein
MTILCGTDLSPAARIALVAAAHVARVRRTSVRFVHVLDIPGADAVLTHRPAARVTAFFEAEERRLLAQLEAEAAPLRALAPIECIVVAGKPAETLVESAESAFAELIVVSAVGKRGESRIRLGRTADQIARLARHPVLVVRDAEPFRAWSTGERPLRILAAVDQSPTSDAALEWIRGFSTAAPVAFTACHVFWPPEVRERFKKKGLAIGEADEDAAAELERELRAHVATVAPDIQAKLRIVGGLGKVAPHLTQVAAEERSDVIVVGTHQRQGLERLWNGSVSRDAIVDGPCSVVAVPLER